VLLDFVTAFSVVAAALAACLCNRTAERIGVDVVDEPPPAVDLDHRDPLPVLGLEGVAVDPDLAQLEAELVPRRTDDTAGRLAQVAARRGVEDDFGYG
jgi:phosphoglycerate dehydrogenase-like enzyme